MKNYTKKEIANLRGRAIIGNVYNRSYDCIYRPRPRTQYMHFWRSTKKKLFQVFLESGLLDQNILNVLTDIRNVLNKYPEPKNSDAENISKEILNISYYNGKN